MSNNNQFNKQSIWPTRNRLLWHNHCSTYHGSDGLHHLYFNEQRIASGPSFWAVVDCAIFKLLKTGQLKKAGNRKTRI